jgi:repressor LexA
MQGLTQRQAQTLDYIRQSIEERGYPPTLREIGEYMGIRSTNGVNDHLRALERKGYLRREDMKSRALRLVNDMERAKALGTAGVASTPTTAAAGFGLGNATGPGIASPAPVLTAIPGGAGYGMSGGVAANIDGAQDDDSIEIQVLGRVAAGLPLLAEENVVDTVKVDRMLVRGGRDVFGLRVQGDSMIEAGILNGDYLFVRKQSTAERGQIVVAMIGDEATVKYYYPERDYIRFQPANSNMAPILVRATDFRATMLLGTVVGVYRRL